MKTKEKNIHTVHEEPKTDQNIGNMEKVLEKRKIRIPIILIYSSNLFQIF